MHGFKLNALKCKETLGTHSLNRSLAGRYPFWQISESMTECKFSGRSRWWKGNFAALTVYLIAPETLVGIA
jgi:hypothetical protein